MWRGCACCEVQQDQPEIFTTHLPQHAWTVQVSDGSVKKQFKSLMAV